MSLAYLNGKKKKESQFGLDTSTILQLSVVTDQIEHENHCIHWFITFGPNVYLNCSYLCSNVLIEEQIKFIINCQMTHKYQRNELYIGVKLISINICNSGRLWRYRMHFILTMIVLHSLLTTHFDFKLTNLYSQMNMIIYSLVSSV